MKLFNKFLLSSFCFPVFLASICFIFFWPFIFKGKIPIPADTIVGMYHPWRDVIWNNFKNGVPFKNYLITDPVRQQYIWKKLAIEQYKKFQWPLWNPYTHAGMPLLANFQTGAFYPLNLIFFILPFNLAWGIYIFLQPLLAALFMYWFLNQLGIKKVASFFGSLIFAFCGFSVAWLEWGNIGHTILWLPLILLAIEKIIKKRNVIWHFLFIFSLAAQFFAGHLQISFYVLIFSFIYLLFSLFSLKDKNKSKVVLIFIFSYFLFILITAIQWLPTLELIKNSARETDQIKILQRNDWFLSPKHLVQLIIPDFFGNPATLNYWGEWNYGEFVSFIGIIPSFFVIFAFFNLRQNSFVKFFTLSFFIFLSFALPTPWAKLPYILKIPFFSSAQPSRLIGLVNFCLASLSAFGFNFFLLAKGKILKKTLLSFVPLFLIILSVWIFVFLARNFYSQADWINNLAITKRNLILPTLIFGLLFLSMCLRLLFKGTYFLKIIIIFLLLISTADLFRFFSKFTSFSPQEWIFPKTKTIEFLEKEKSLFRFATVDRQLFPSNFAAAYKLQTISGYDPLYLKDYAVLITKMESGIEGIASFNRIIEPTNYQSKIFNELNVKYILSLTNLESSKLRRVFQEGQTRTYENIEFAPRIKLIPYTNKDDIKILEYETNKIRLIINSQNDKELIIKDIYYPGWQALINNQTTRIEKSKEGLRKLTIKKGINNIEVFYFPTSFKLGLILLGSSFIVFILTVRKLKL